MLYCAVNGQQQLTTSVVDRGLAYGDGVFTTAKIVNGKVESLDAHIHRLQQSCQSLAIDYDGYPALRSQLITLAQNYQLAVLKVVITAGEGGRGYSRLGANKPTTIVSVFDFPSHYQHWQQVGISLGNAQVQLGLNPRLAGIKHLNRLEQVLIRRELDETSFDDVVVTDLNNNIVEASSANIFWFEQNQLYTSDIIDAGVNGLMRQLIVQLGQQGLLPKTHIVTRAISALASATSIMLTNSVMGIVPVNCYQGRPLDIAPVTSLQQQLMDYLGDKNND